ncbi:MAG: hypothetical protein EOP23_19960 [Hyphomicrobiales bacterium]|nr:MAG: hypothetical protein EOP23_19960 [Hyphomicrobiales bacterium]
MSVSRRLGETPTIIDPDLVMALPPFWELEDLVATGLDQQAALAVMAARRSSPRLVGYSSSPIDELEFMLRFGPAEPVH